jgi:SAM-dependent methyltransferase
VVEPLLERMAPARVLEVGCGLGGFGARMAARYEYTGIEQDETSFRVARSRVEKYGGRVVLGVVADVDATPVDLVCAFEVLEHIEDDVAALREWSQRLAPGGWVLLSVPADPERFGPSDVSAGHYRRYGPDEIEKVLLDSGLADVEIHRYGWPLGYVTEGLRNRIAARRRSGGDTSMQARTAGSARHFQPGSATGPLVALVTIPFVAMQRLRPDRGVGLVVAARKPLP